MSAKDQYVTRRLNALSISGFGSLMTNGNYKYCGYKGTLSDIEYSLSGDEIVSIIIHNYNNQN